MPFPKEVKTELIRILDPWRVLDDETTLHAYRCDGMTLHPSQPMGVIFPETTEEVSQICKFLYDREIPFLPRGAGTSLSGGAIALNESVIVEMFRFREIYDIDSDNRTITIGAGMVNLRVSQAVKEHGLQFVPDPSSQKACSVGGNVGENAGGPHTLKYGVTVNHVLGIEAVLSDGTVFQIGGNHFSHVGPDVLGLFNGSEGTFGIITKITCRLVPLPEKVTTILATFASMDDACRSVSDVISAGIIPAAMEMLDSLIIEALEKAEPRGFPSDVEALLIVELEDLEEALPEERDQILSILEKNNAERIRYAKSEEEREMIWSARKGAFGAIGAVSPSFYTQDGVVPRKKLPEIFRHMRELSQKYNLRIANVFHAGDGNLHPLICFDSRKPEEAENATKLGEEILTMCLEMGGSLTGEHGIGLEKNNMMPRLFSEDDLDNFRDVKLAFNPRDLLNPGKIFPTPGKCAEMRFVGAKTKAAI